MPKRIGPLTTVRRLGVALTAAVLAVSVLAGTPAQAAPAAASSPQTPRPGPTPSAGHKASDNLPKIQDGFGPTAAQSKAMAAAAAQARATGRPVAVPALTTETQAVTAQPGGGFGLTANPNPVRTERHGTWVPVNTALHANANGTLSPAATAYGSVTFSGGGTAPLATTTAGSVSYSVTWPGTLPAPHVSGDTAVYPNVLSGVDLQVSATVSGGFSDVLVVRTAAAGRNPALKSLTLAARSTGGQLKAAQDGGLALTVPHAANTLQAATPLMWDSNTSTGPATTPGRGAPTGGTAPASTADPSSASHPGLAARTSRVRVRPGRSSLALTPDRTLLTSPTTVFPVYIDPTFNWHPTTGGTPSFDEVKRGEPCTNTSLFDNTTDKGDFGDLGVGYNQFESCFGPQRAYYQWQLPTVIWGAHIGNVTGQPGATVNVTKVFSQVCGVTSSVTLRQTGGIGAGTTWNSQPAVISTVGARSFGPSFNDHCTGNPDPSAGYDVTSQVATAARQHAAQFTVALVGDESATSTQFSRFTDNPTLQIFYNRIPNTPGANQLDGVTGNDHTGCATTTPYPFMGKTVTTNTPVLTAGISDPDGDHLKANYRYWIDGTTTMSTGSSADNLTSGAKAKFNLPATFVSSLVNGKIVDWQVQATDGEDTSGWSPICHFIAEPTAPSAPAINSADGRYPDDGHTGAVAGTTGRFSLSSTGGAVTGIVDGVDQAPPTTGVPVADNAPFGPGGSISPAARWKLSEGTGSTAADSVGDKNPLTLSGTGATWANDPTHGEVLALDGTSGFAATISHVINTAGSFTVSAWVNLASTATTQTFVTQEGDTSGAFSLGYNATTAKWFWARPNTPNSTTSVTITATPGVVLNTWTHLAGSYDASSGQMALFVNDLTVATGVDSTPWDSTGVFVVGHGYTGGAATTFTHGSISDVQVYQAPVSPNDLARIGTGGTDAPVGHWPLTEGTGTTAADSSGNGHPLTLTGGATWASTPNPALTFNGTTAAAATAGPVVNTANSFTISAWVDLTSNTAFSVFASQQGTTEAGFLLEYDPDTNKWAFDRLAADVPSTSTTTASAQSTAPAALNTWTHLAGNYYTGTHTLTLYVNGVATGTAIDATPFNATGPLLVGRGFINGVPNAFAHGSVADVQVYSTSLDGSEIAMLHASSTIPVTPKSPGPHTIFGYTKDAAGDVSGYQSYPFVAANDPTYTCASLAACYDNTGISPDTNHALANFDGSGNSFSGTDLTNAGWLPGGDIDVDGADFALPQYGAGQPDNVLAANQTVTFHQSVASTGSTALNFLVSASNAVTDGGASVGPINADNTVPIVPADIPVADTYCFDSTNPSAFCAPTGTINFSDGSTQSYDLTVPDWTSGPEALDTTKFPHENLPGTTQNTTATPRIYSFAVPITPEHAGTSIVSVVLPDVSRQATSTTQALHVFSMAARDTTNANAPTGLSWTGTWSSPTEGVFAYTGVSFSNDTFRQAVVPSISGNTLRVKFDDALGINPLDIGDATIATAQGAGSPVPQATPVHLTFANAPATNHSATNLPEGGMIYSDPINFPVRAGVPLLISFQLTNSVPFLVMHTDSANGDRQWVSVAGTGDHTSDTTGTVFTATGAVNGSNASSVVTGLDVATNGAPTAAVLGEGVIDHANTVGKPEADTTLAGNLVQDESTTPAPFGLLNEDMEANQLLKDYPESDGSGPAALSRLDRDILDQPNVNTVIIDEGLEDVLAGTGADDLADAYTELATDLTDSGVNVIFVGLTPCEGYLGDAATPNDPCTAANDTQRVAVNGFLSQPVANVSPPQVTFINSDAAVGVLDPADDKTIRLSPSADIGDHVNLTDDGYAALTSAYLGSQDTWALDDGTDNPTTTTLADTANDTINPYLFDNPAAGSNPAALNGTPTWTADPTRGEVLTLDGATNYAQTPGPVLDTTGSFSISAWVKLSSGTKTGVVASQIGTNGSAFTLRYDTNGTDTWSFTQSTIDGATDYGPGTIWVDDSNPADAQVGVWTHVVGTYDAAAHALAIYVNGQRRDQLGGSWPTWNAAGPLLIGAGQSVADGTTTTGGITNFFPGEISDVRAWNYSLDGKQVAALHDEVN